MNIEYAFWESIVRSFWFLFFFAFFSKLLFHFIIYLDARLSLWKRIFVNGTNIFIRLLIWLYPKHEHWVIYNRQLLVWEQIVLHFAWSMFALRRPLFDWYKALLCKLYPHAHLVDPNLFKTFNRIRVWLEIERIYWKMKLSNINVAVSRFDWNSINWENMKEHLDVGLMVYW